MFHTIPGNMSIPGGYGRSLGVFASTSRTFTQKELSNPLNTLSVNSVVRPLWQEVNGERSVVDLNSSNLLKGFKFSIDEQIDYGVLQQDNNNNDDDNFTAYWPNPYGTPPGDPNATLTIDYRAAVPGEREMVYEDYQSLTSVRLAIRDARQAYHIGANKDQTILVDFPNLSAEALGLTTNLRANGGVYNGVDPLLDGSLAPDFRMHLSLRVRKDAEHAISVIDEAIQKVSYNRSRLGAFQNSLEKTVDYLGISHENMVSSESRIRDVDMAKEMSSLTRNQVLMQSGTAMLSQANQKGQMVLSLLG
ncbi:MAG: flagellin [Candidatus Muiribacteriaceae bacterium]